MHWAMIETMKATFLLQLDGENSITSLFSAIHHIDFGATIIAIIGLAIILLFETDAFKKISKIVPGGLAAVIVCVVISELIFKNFPSLAISDKHLVNVPVPKSINDFKDLLIFPDFSGIMRPEVWIIAMTITAVASIETLLCIEAIDKLDPEKE